MLAKLEKDLFGKVFERKLFFKNFGVICSQKEPK
jgi:hypothetical protein